MAEGTEVSTQELRAALRESEQRFRAVFDNAAIGKAIVSPQGRYLQANRAYCAMFGYEERELLGLSPIDLTDPEDRAANAELMRRLLSGETPSGRLVKRYRRKDGRMVWGELTLTLSRDASGAPVCFLGEVVDLTETKRTEELLRDREAKLAEAQRVAKVGSWEYDIAADHSTWSAELYRIFGVDPETFVPSIDAAMDRFHEADRERVRAVVERAIREGRPFEFEARFELYGGELRLLHSVGRAELDAEGAPVRLYGIAQDVTDRRRVEALVRDREAKLAEAQRVAHVGSWEYDIATGRSIWSDEMYRIFDLDPSRFDPTRDSATHRIHPEDVERSGAFVQETIRNGTPYEYEFRIVREDGDVRHLRTIGRAELGADRRPSRVYGIVQDVSEVHRAQEALRASETRFRSAFWNAAIGKAIATPELRFLQVNHALCEMLGYTEAELLALSPVELTPPEDFPAAGALLHELLSGQASTGRMLKRYIRKDQSLLWGDLTFTLVRDAAGRPEYFIAEVVDVTERRNAERLLREREANLAEAQRLAHVGSWEWDLASGRVQWSDELYRILGVQPVERAASYEAALGRLHPDDRARTAEVMERALADGTPFEIENRTLREDGTVQTLWTSGRADLDEHGKPVRLYGATQDVTERKRAEAALRTSEQRFRNLYTQAPVLLTVSGPDGRFREVSNFWLERMGYAREEVIGHEGREFITPESAERLLADFERTRAAGELVIPSTPMTGLRKDGTHVDALTTSLLEVDSRGELQGVVTVGIDVTHIRREEEAVRESEARYRALVEHAPEAIVVADGDNGKFVDVNEQAVRLFRRTRGELLALGPAECSPPLQPNGRTSSEMAQDMIRRTAVETQTFEWTHTDGEGRDVPCLIRLSKMPDRTRYLIRATITDISQQKAIEEKLRQDDRLAAIGALAAGVAHEIGNPLLALSMAAQSLQRRAQDEYSSKKLTLIREHIDRISKIVRQMSDLARAPAHTRSAVDLRRVLERSLEVVRYDKRARQVAIEVDPGRETAFVRAAEDQLVQVCLNLALNALDAVAANPPDRPKSLRIGVRRFERDGRSFVRAGFLDSGPGIPEASRAKIFQPFFTTKEPGKGTGLGLSVSYRIVEEHQGKLGFDTDPARGTEFFFELPAEGGA